MIDTEHTDNNPGALSWTTAVVSTITIILIFIAADSLASAKHYMATQEMVLRLFSENNNPEIILDNYSVKSLPLARLEKIEKLASIHKSAREDDFDTAKLLVDDPYFLATSKVSELRSTLALLSKIKQDEKVEARKKDLPDKVSQNKMKNSVLEITLSMIKEESLPKLNAISQIAYKFLN